MFEHYFCLFVCFYFVCFIVLRDFCKFNIPISTLHLFLSPTKLAYEYNSIIDRVLRFFSFSLFCKQLTGELLALLLCFVLAIKNRKKLLHHVHNSDIIKLDHQKK